MNMRGSAIAASGPTLRHHSAATDIFTDALRGSLPAYRGIVKSDIELVKID